jgi:hypothetical protein
MLRAENLQCNFAKSQVVNQNCKDSLHVRRLYLSLGFRKFLATLTDYILLLWARVKTALPRFGSAARKIWTRDACAGWERMACLLLFPQNKLH